MRKRRSATLVVFGASLLMTAMMSCQHLPAGRGQGVIFGPTVATLSFEGDSSSDSALYLYARMQIYQLLTELGSFRTDSAGVAGALDVCIEQGSSVVDYTDLLNGKWRALGCVLRSGPVSADYPYLESGLSLILVRRSGPDWQAGILGLTTRQTKRMFVSSVNTRTTLGSDARRFTEGPRIYVCYTCDRKACCPQNAASVTNPTQAQADVDHIASIW